MNPDRNKSNLIGIQINNSESDTTKAFRYFYTQLIIQTQTQQGKRDVQGAEPNQGWKSGVPERGGRPQGWGLCLGADSQEGSCCVLALPGKCGLSRSQVSSGSSASL